MLSLLYLGVKAQQYFVLKLELHVLSCVLLRNVQFVFRFFLSFFLPFFMALFQAGCLHNKEVAAVVTKLMAFLHHFCAESPDHAFSILHKRAPLFQ